MTKLFCNKIFSGFLHPQYNCYTVQEGYTVQRGRGVSQHGSVTSMEEGGALIWRSKGRLLVALECKLCAIFLAAALQTNQL